ncbi:Signal peptidase I [Scopulibacillus darangshiensis]|uniref:Signal peptidase I n=2 Tax=Scopulibacillus darangshiensis TaxID=442528 RepID=A0A4R2P7L7_9BACL|nr:Signal peptidase I [Scopulibacillus darangshiensis]
MQLIFCVIILLLVITAYQSIKHPGWPVSFLGYMPLTVLSNSMNPTFETGDLVISKQVNPADIKKGDVITFKGDHERLITHRVIKINHEQGAISFVTKGDNNNVKDQKSVPGEHLVGKQTFQIPNAGYVVNFARRPIGVILLIFLPLAGYVLLELYERFKMKREELT